MEDRKEISLEEAVRLKRKNFNVDLQVSGTARIIDKDGNVKGEMEIVSLDAIEEVEENADN